MRADLDSRCRLAVPLGFANEAQCLHAGPWGEPIDEDDPVEVIGLMLNATGEQVTARNHQRLPVHVHALGHEAVGAFGVEFEAGE